MHKRFRHLCLALAALIAAGTLLAALIPAAEAATYKKGSSGAVVSQIQTKLKNWGYYAGDVDGIYGSATERAVRAFQRKNGLTVDGKAGTQTLEALGLPADSGANSGGSGGMTGAQLSEKLGIDEKSPALRELLEKRSQLSGRDVFLANIPIFFLNRD
mgnify:CR=1 FL=1